MKQNLTDVLCTRCGLCCNGSLFADVELAGTDEAAALEILGLNIEDDEDDAGLLLQPCTALKGKRCSIYPHRPDCCRTFECRLLQEVTLGVVDVKRAQEKIAEAWRRIGRVKKLIAQLGSGKERLPLKECCDAVLAHSEKFTGDDDVNRKRARLQAAMTSLERLLQETFLGG